MTLKTRTILGNKVQLTEGQIYRASRPFAQRGVTRFTITIKNLSDGFDSVRIHGMSYDQANKFLNKFNNGTTSFDGRVW